MYQLCRNEPDFRNFALSILEAEAHVPDADPHILWTFLDDFASEIPKEWLFKLAAARTPYSGSAGLFWLCALHKSDAKTLDLTLNIAKTHSDTWFRRFAFALAFSHYFDMPEAAEKLIDAAYAHEEDRNANKSVLTGMVSYNLPTSRPPNALAILHRVNATRFARSFNRICKNAGIDTGAPIPDDKNRAFLEIINSFLSGELAKPLVNAMVWASLSKSERATYRKSLESETFEKAQERKLKALDPADARGIAMWLDTAIGGSITQFGYRGRNSGRLIDKALEHLSSATTGHAADHLRMTRQHYDAVLRNVELLWHDPTTNALRRKYSSIETEIAERAYHRLLDGLNKDPDTAVLAALDDAVQCAQKS